MSTFILKNKALNYTPVSNIFIEQYMPKARGEFVKVFLLLLKQNVNGEPGISSEIMARMLSLLESDIMNALHYWNEEGVLKLTPIDKFGNYSIDFLPLDSDKAIESEEDESILNALTEPDVTSMLKEIEKILSRTINYKEMQICIEWNKNFNFSNELISLLVEYCSAKEKTNFRYMDKVAASWYEKGVKSIDAAQSLIARDEEKWKKIREILKYLGIKNTDIMKPQEDMLEKWLFIFNFKVEIIQKACDRCFQRLNRADFKYIDSILTDWHKNKISTVADIELKDINFKKAHGNKNYANNKNNANNTNNVGKFNQQVTGFREKNYDYDALQRELLGWDD
ncbi:DnaD domain protein [uncultured Clostridium sp.]|uniref:DnaD domain protein n=1 Tax=uncultured Clostridium sp. TaxID=59620 RepID=UPI002637BB91|nr:DnaD domain protein [uncultured Clostridium sp.]